MTENKYNVITLCGSTKFKDEYMQAQIKLTLEGNIILACPIFHHADNLEVSDEICYMLNEMHKKRIDMSSEIYVINKDGYIGNSTRNEIEYAGKTGKKVRYMFEQD